MKIEKMDDEKCLKTFIEFLEKRINMNTGFVVDKETGNITHQVMQISCGEYTTMSQPEPLEVVLRPATAEEQGAVLN